MGIARGLVIGVLVAGLAGCASGPRTVTAEVRANAAQGPGAALLQAVRYRFDPPPAVVAGQPAPAQVEALAQDALTRVGAVRDDARAQVGVQASASVYAGWTSTWAEPSNTRIALGFGTGWRGGGVGFGWGGPLGWDDSVPIYISQVSLVMRDVRSGQIVYDTRARHDGTWSNTGAVLAALFAAALQGYPNPPPGPQRVDVPMLPVAAPAAVPASAPR
ncbi:MAG TPA: hypothetical protein PKE15_01590 [Ottowia sp.]|nr:hypothetical protein [Ottowia sp.]